MTEYLFARLQDVQAFVQGPNSATPGNLAVFADSSGKVIADGGPAGGLAADSVTNTILANMAAWSIKVRNAGTAGDPSDAALADFTTEGSPAAGMYLVGFLGTGELRRFNIGSLPTGSGMANFVVAGDAGTPQTITDGNTLSIVGSTGISTSAGVTDTLTVTLDATLAALSAFNTNGLIAQTAADTFAGRTITGTAAQITVANGDGVAGNPTLSFPADVLIPTVLTVPNTGLHLLDTNASHDLIIAPGSDLTADHTLTITTGDANRTLTISANATVSQDYSTTGNPQFATIELGAAADTTLARVSAGVVSIEGVTILTTATGQPLDGTLTALAAFNTNGLLAQTAADTFAGRTITGTANQITVADGNGVAGNPTLSLNATDIIVPAIITAPNTGLHILDTNASHDLILKPGSDITADRTLTLTTGDADRTLTISASATVSQDYSTTGNPQFATIELGAASDTTLSRSAAGKLDVEGHTVFTDDQEGQGPLVGGTTVTVKDLGTISSGTVTPDPGARPMQKYTNGGAHTLAPSGNVGAYLLTIVNNASAGAITTSGWTKVAGDSFTTTNTNKFRCHCSIDGDGSLLVVQALQ